MAEDERASINAAPAPPITAPEGNAANEMGERKRTRGNRSTRRWPIAAVLFLCLTGLIMGLYLARVGIAQLLSQYALARLGMGDTRLQWTRLDFDRCEIVDIRLPGESYSVDIDRLRLAYDPARIWKERKIHSVRVEGLRLFYDLTGPSTLDYNALDADLKGGIPFPLDSVSISRATLHLLTAAGPLEGFAELSLERASPNLVTGHAQLDSGEGSLELKIDLSERIEFLATGYIPEIRKSLDARYPAWIDALSLPPDAHIALSHLRFESSGSFHGIQPGPIRVSASLGPLALKDRRAQLATDSLETQFTIEENEIQEFQLFTKLAPISFQAFQLSSIPIRITAEDPARPRIAIGACHWESNGGGRGSFSAMLEPSLNDAFALEEFTLEADVHSARIGETTMAPFQLAGVGSLDGAVITGDAIRLSSYPHTSIEDFRLTASDLRSGKPKWAVEAEVRSDSEAPLADWGDWHLEARLNPMADPQAARISLSTIESPAAISRPGISLAADAALNLDVQRWPDSASLAMQLDLEGREIEGNLGNCRLQGGKATVSMSSDRIPLPALERTLDGPSDLADFLFPRLRYEIAFSGSELDGPAGLQMKWFSGILQSDESVTENPIQSNLSFSSGIVQFGPEEFQQLALRSKFSGRSRQLKSTSSASFLFEGSTVDIQLDQEFENRPDSLSSRGVYRVDGLDLARSDILSRHMASLGDSTLSGRFKVSGETFFQAGKWDASARVELKNGFFGIPSRELKIEDLEATLALQSIAPPLSPSPQSISAKSIALGDLRASNFRAKWSLPKENRLRVEGAELETFDGSLILEPVEFSLDDPSADLLFRFEGISLEPALAMADFFRGRVTGRLNGRLPISLKNGRPTLGEGYLELDPETEAHFAYDAEGLFTENRGPADAGRTLGEKTLDRLGLEPNALLEDALANLNITRLRVDLFNRKFPQTPMKIQLAGIADTGKAVIPLNITTNINGTVAEFFHFLTRLDSLGGVATPSAQSGSDASF